MNKLSQGLINHVGLVLDASSSMNHLSRDVVAVADGQVKSLAELSLSMDQETRATVYTFSFAKVIDCVFYDKDVLRLPSLKDKYHTNGNTALIDATMKAIRELKQTAILYGDHAFLLYVLTDGMENDSRNYGPPDLKKELESLPDYWTVAALVPNSSGVEYAKQVGFFPGNIAIWNTTSAGMHAVGSKIQAATQQFMQQRVQGVHGTKNLFQVSTASVKVTDLKVLDSSKYIPLLVGPEDGGRELRDFVTEKYGSFKKGMNYYQLTKKEEVQPSKDVLLMKSDGTMYFGIEARRMIGIPDGEYANVLPENHTDYTIFVRSDSVNRKLVPNTMLIVRK